MSKPASGCGCGTPTTQRPIVCLLEGRTAQERRLAEFAALFVYLERTEQLSGAFRWYFRAEESCAEQGELEARVRDLAAQEQSCCPFFQFSVRREKDLVVWEARAPEAAQEVLEAFMLLPRDLQRGTSVERLKQRFSSAGLQFSEPEAG